MTTNPTLRQIAELPNLPQQQLKAMWREYFGKEPPAYRKGFLVRGLAHQIQELTWGGLSASAQARLEALIEEQERQEKGRGRKRLKPGDKPVTGTRLVREWQGMRHEVTVVEDGFAYQGRRFKSLSAVAREIAGTRWNGPLFFGLRSSR